MKKRKALSERQKEVLAIIIAIVVMVLIVIAGYCIGFFTTPKSMGNNEFADCEKVAQQIYDQLGHEMIEVPQGYSMKKTEIEITVEKDGFSGSVKATLSNGELSFEHNDGTPEKVKNGITVGIISLIVGAIILKMLDEAFLIF